MTLIENTDLFPHVNEYDVILVGTNTYCSLTQGFQRDVMLHFPHVQDENMKTRYGDRDKLGTILQVEGTPKFILCFICEGNFRPDISTDYLDYGSLEKCLSLAKIITRGQKVATTLMGASRFDGNGDKKRILSLFERILGDVEVDVYDYFQMSKDERKKAIRMKELAVKETDREAYYRMVAERKEREKKIKEINGHTRT